MELMMSERKIAALESLLTMYLQDDRYQNGKDHRISVSVENSCSVNFNFPPSQSEIDALIEYFTFIKKQRPEIVHRVSLDDVNSAFVKAGLDPIPLPIKG
jgi:hypothetical protein